MNISLPIGCQPFRHISKHGVDAIHVENKFGKFDFGYLLTQYEHSNFKICKSRLGWAYKKVVDEKKWCGSGGNRY